MTDPDICIRKLILSNITFHQNGKATLMFGLRKIIHYFLSNESPEQIVDAFYNDIEKLMLDN